MSSNVVSYVSHWPAAKRVQSKKLRIAVFGIRSIPFTEGGGGADRFAQELYPRIVKRGHEVVAYTRTYGKKEHLSVFEGIRLVPLRTVKRRGFDTLVHSLRTTVHIIVHNTGDTIHIINGGNSLWAWILRLSGKKTFISQDGLDWRRTTWPWYGRLYLFISSYLCALCPHNVIFDNLYSKNYFEKKFGRQYVFIPHGSEVPSFKETVVVMKMSDLRAQEYFLFVGRLVPDKGVHYLIKAFERVNTEKKLVIVGGSRSAGKYERMLKTTNDPRILFLGFISEDDKKYTLLRNAYALVHPSDLEGSSHVLLEAAALETPVICSDLPQNLSVLGNRVMTFRKGDIDALQEAIEHALLHPEGMRVMASSAKSHVDSTYRWEEIVDQYLSIFSDT